MEKATKKSKDTRKSEKQQTSEQGVKSFTPPSTGISSPVVQGKEIKSFTPPASGISANPIQKKGSSTFTPPDSKSQPVQLMAKEEEPLQMMKKEEETKQMKKAEEEEPLQMLKDEEETKQMKKAEEEEPLQMLKDEEETKQMKKTEEEEPLQMLKDEEETKQLKEEEEEVLQGKGIQNTSSALKVNSGQSSGNKSLPEPVRMKMENAFGQDFSQVQIHESSKASELGALAYTQGKEIHFAPGQYNPETQKGQELLGHELTHVVQQQQGKVKPTTQLKGAQINDDSALEKEADQMGKLASEGKSTGTKNSVAGSSNDTMQKKDEAATAKTDSLATLDQKYEFLENDLNTAGHKFYRNNMAWGMVMRNIGSSYARAYKSHEDLVKDNNAYKEDVKAVFTSVISVVGAGAFSWVSTTGFMAARLAALKIPNPEAVVNISEDVLQAGWDKASPLAGGMLSMGGNSQSASGEIPLVFQNNILNKMDSANIAVSNVLIDSLTKVGSIRRQLFGMGKVTPEVLARENQRYATIEAIVKKACDEIVKTSEIQKTSDPDQEILTKAFEKGIWSMWIPKLKTVEKRHIPNYDEFGVRDPNGGDYNVDVYETWLSGALKAKFKDLNIVAESGAEIEYWTSEDDVKKLIAWAQSYKPKTLV